MQFGFVAAVFAMLAVAAAFLLPTLWQGARRSAYAVALLLPVAAVLLYVQIGTPAALDLKRRYAPATFGQEVDALELRMRAHPGDVDGWVLLGHSRKEQQRYAEAREAYSQALKLAPNQPDLMVEIAETMTLDDPTHRIGEPALKLLHTAQRIDPRNQRALWFLGIAAYQRGDYPVADATWESLLPLVQSDTAAALRKQIDDARTRAGLPPLAEPAAAASGPALLTVKVDIAPSLRAKLAPGDVIFVYARAQGGPPMPLAVKRVPAKDFPLTVTLGDADGPMPTMRLSQQTTVDVLARVSHSGDAIPQSGDFEAKPQPARVGTNSPIALTIDSIHP
ncbi:MAG TPA: tetratricopeptide repeat protein [Xanthomonadaceae bacterium]|nr:tetratricopeptide repeat protein [Xanthomonadaceae bacterium]